MCCALIIIYTNKLNYFPGWQPTAINSSQRDLIVQTAASYCSIFRNINKARPLYLWQANTITIKTLFFFPPDGKIFSEHVWMWHGGSSFLPHCLCSCNLPHISQPNVQCCTLADLQHCATLWCVQHVPCLRLSQHWMRSHQSGTAAAALLRRGLCCANTFTKGLRVSLQHAQRIITMRSYESM